MKFNDNEDIIELISRCNTFIELKSILFKKTQERYGVETTTSIKKEIKDIITKEALIKVANNFKDKKEKFELIKLLEVKELTYKDVSQMFEENDLFEAIKEFNIEVTNNDLEKLYKNTKGKEKKLLKSLVQMDIEDEKTFTQIILENIEDEQAIDYIREYNLKLTDEQQNDIIAKYQKEQISDENRYFIESIIELSQKNDEITSTINYQILSDRYKSLHDFLPIITCHPEIQEQIISLKDNDYKTFSKCLEAYSNKTQDWTPVAVSILENINQYPDLIGQLDIEQYQKQGQLDLLTKILSEPNYFNINNIQEYFEKRDRVCNLILNNPNAEELGEYTHILQMNEDNRMRFAVLEKNFGLSLEQAQTLISKFGDDIQSIDGLGENANTYKSLIEKLKYICNTKNVEELSRIDFNTKDKFLDVNVIERTIKDIYDKDYVSQLYRPIQEDLEREEDGIQIYKAGKSTNGEFLMETHSPGAVYKDETLKTGEFKKAWNKPKVKSQAFCTVTSRQDMLIATKTPFLEYGFYDFEEGSLRVAGYEDISSDATMPVIFADDDEKYCDVYNKINNTRNINENDRSRTQIDGTRKQPDYIKFRKSKFIPKEVSKTIWENSKKAAKQFGIPIVVVDQDECTKRENEELQIMLKEFSESRNPELISKIIVKFENNRKGNDFGKDKNTGKPINTDFEIDGESAILTRNEMLNSIINTIKECENPSLAYKLYETLNIEIKNETRKFKKPDAKTINSNGIPVVTKNPIDSKEYFSIGRDKKDGEYIYISAYKNLLDLKQTVNKEDSKESSESVLDSAIEATTEKTKIGTIKEQAQDIKTVRKEKTEVKDKKGVSK